MADQKPHTNCALPDEVFRKLKKYADERGLKMRWVLGRAVEDYLKAHK